MGKSKSFRQKHKKNYKGKKAKKKALSKGFKSQWLRMLGKFTDKFQTIQRDQYFPADCFGANQCYWKTIDPGLDVNTELWSKQVNLNNNWGRTALKNGYVSVTNFNILRGNTIRRMSFKISYNMWATYHDITNLNAPVYQDYIQTTAQAPFVMWSQDNLTLTCRMTLLRATKNIDDATVESYLGDLTNNDFYQPYNRTIVAVTWDKFHKLNLNSGNRINKTYKFTGKKGGQRLNYSRDINGAPYPVGAGDVYYPKAGKLYVVFRYTYPTWANQNINFALLPQMGRFVITCNYIDI